MNLWADGDRDNLRIDSQHHLSGEGQVRPSQPSPAWSLGRKGAVGGTAPSRVTQTSGPHISHQRREPGPKSRGPLGGSHLAAPLTMDSKAEAAPGPGVAGTPRSSGHRCAEGRALGGLRRVGAAVESAPLGRSLCLPAALSFPDSMGQTTSHPDLGFHLLIILILPIIKVTYVP